MRATDEQTQEYVLNIVANDYENFDLIKREAEAWAKQDQREISVDLLKSALMALIEKGFVGCFEASKSTGDFKECEVNLGRPDLWFRITTKGRAALSS